MRYLPILLLPLLLTSCGGKMSETTVEKVFDEGGNTIRTTVTTIAEASVQKEQAVHDTLKKYLEIIPSTGMRMGWQAVTRTHFYEGMKDPVITTEFMPTFSYVDPSSIQKMPTKPSEHPAWEIGGKVLENAMRYGVIGWGIYEAAGVAKAWSNNAGSRSYDYSNFNDNSNNSSNSTDNSIGAENSAINDSTGPDNSSSNSSTTDNSTADNSTSDSSDNSTADNSTSDSSDNSSTDNSDSSVGPVDNSDNSVTQPPPVVEPIIE